MNAISISNHPIQINVKREVKYLRLHDEAEQTAEYDNRYLAVDFRVIHYIESEEEGEVVRGSAGISDKVVTLMAENDFIVELNGQPVGEYDYFTMLAQGQISIYELIAGTALQADANGRFDIY